MISGQKDSLFKAPNQQGLNDYNKHRSFDDSF